MLFKFSRIDQDHQYGEVKAVTYSELLRTAEARLFSLKEKIESRYQVLEEDALLAELLGKPEQKQLGIAVGE